MTTAIDPPSVPAMLPAGPFGPPAVRDRRRVDPPTVPTPVALAEQVLAEVDQCCCGHHLEAHWTRCSTAGELVRGCGQCPHECPGFRALDDRARFLRRVDRELRLLP